LKSYVQIVLVHALPSGLSHSSQDSQLRKFERWVFKTCPSLKSICIPARVEIICSDCFASCKSLTSYKFELNSRLKPIAFSAFSFCSPLRLICIPPAFPGNRILTLRFCLFSCHCLLDLYESSLKRLRRLLEE
jgi:hypothetical protein